MGLHIDIRFLLQPGVQETVAGTLHAIFNMK